MVGKLALKLAQQLVQGWSDCNFIGIDWYWNTPWVCIAAGGSGLQKGRKGTPSRRSRQDEQEDSGDESEENEKDEEAAEARKRKGKKKLRRA